MATLYESFNDSFNQLPMKIYKHDLSGKYIWAPLHWHRSIEILITFEGRLGLNVGSDNFDFTEDDWLIVNSSELHSSRYIHLSDHFKGISLLISHPFVEYWLGKELFFFNPHIPEVTAKLKAIAKQVYDYDENSPYYSLVLMKHVCDLLLLLGENCVRQNISYQIPFYKEQAKATEFLEYIEMNYQEKLTLNEIAKQFKYSPGYFSRFFKEIVGVNYYSYLNFVRVNHATEQLLENHATLTDCALNNGFPNTKSFITMFKKQYGCTPGKFLNSQ